jgi:ribosome maturation factor RimP
VTVKVPATRKQPSTTVELPYAAVSKAVVQVEFSRPEADAHGTDPEGTTATDDIDEES